MPKKLLVYGAQFADAFDDAAGFGWTVAPPVHRLGAASSPPRTTRSTGSKASITSCCTDSGVTLIEGARPPVDRAHRRDRRQAPTPPRNILIATGAHPVLPAIPGIEHAITSNEALDLAALPRRIVIVGGGYIARRVRRHLPRLGAEVTLIIRGERPAAAASTTMSGSALAQELRKRGIEIRARTEYRPASTSAATAMISTTATGDEISADLVMYATGRKPNTRNIGLEEVGVQLQRGRRGRRRRMVAHRGAAYLRGGRRHRPANLTPVAIAEGRALAETLFNNNPMTIDHDNVADGGVQPAAGRHGRPDASAQARQAAASRRHLSRALPPDEAHAVGPRGAHHDEARRRPRARDRVLGCHMVGADAPEIIQGLAIAVKCGATKRQFDQTIGIHPTAAEEFVTMRDKVPEPKAEAAAS